MKKEDGKVKENEEYDEDEEEDDYTGMGCMNNIRMQSHFDSSDDEIINMQPIDLSQSNNLGFRANFSISSPSKYSKMSLSKMSSASLIYKKKMDRLMHSIKV